MGRNFMTTTKVTYNLCHIEAVNTDIKKVIYYPESAVKNFFLTGIFDEIILSS